MKFVYEPWNQAAQWHNPIYLASLSARACLYGTFNLYEDRWVIKAMLPLCPSRFL
jgi:hypothetical protein